MDDQFHVDENGFTSDGYRRLEPVSKHSMYAGNAILLVIFGVVAAICIRYSDNIWSDGHLVSMSAIVLFSILAVYLLVGPIVFYRRYRYRMDDDKLEIRKGIVYVSHTLVPIERIHQVEVVRGPINHHYGLADVNVTTAGGVVSLEFLQEDVAESVASKLNENVVRMLKQRE